MRKFFIAITLKQAGFESASTIVLFLLSWFCEWDLPGPLLSFLLVCVPYVF